MQKYRIFGMHIGILFEITKTEERRNETFVQKDGVAVFGVKIAGKS